MNARIAAAIESYDLQCAIRRWEITRDPLEITSLTTAQLVRALRLIRADPTWPVWKYAESRLGWPLTLKDI